MSDETSIQKPEVEAVTESIASNEEDSANQLAEDEKKTPKRTPKRRSFIERAQRESEELVRTMGGTLELEGGRRTRSSTRGTPTRAVEAVTPPPSKKSRSSPATTKSGGRVRGARKLNVGGEDETEPETEKSKQAQDVKQEKEDEKVPAKATESVKVNDASKKAKKVEKEQKPKDAIVKGKEDKKTTEDFTKSKEKASKATKSKDQPDAAAKVHAVQETNQNNIDNDKLNTKDADVKEKTPEPLGKSEEPAKVESPTKSDDSAPSSDTPMEVDDDEKEREKPSAEQNSADTTSSDTSVSVVSTETVKEKVESKEPQEKVEAKNLHVKPAEPAKKQTPEPMEVVSSSKISSEAAEPKSPVNEVVTVDDDSEAIPTPPSNNEVVEMATKAEEDKPDVPEKEANASGVESTSAENNIAKADDVPASNDVSKLAVPVAPVDSAVTEPPAAEAAVKEQTNCENKSEHNDNGEPKIVNSATQDGENHVTPQACN